MNLTLARIKQVFPTFNETAITAEDFWRAAKKEKIVVKEMPLTVNGYYQRKRDKHYILINKRLSGGAWLHTALHEFSHYILDVPGEADHFTLYRRGCGESDDRRERFADAFALVGLLPFPDLEKLMREDISDDPWLLNIVRARIAVLTDFQI